MTTPDNDDDHPAKRLGRKLREARIAAGYRSQEQGRRKHVGVQVIPAARAANAGHVGAFTIASLDDADVLLMEALEDVTTDKRASIRNGLHVFDKLRLVALSGPESLELITKAAESCEP
jgi:Domain of unknown function (DUF5753)